MRQLVLCFDATGYRFHGDESDSNILKIFKMLDRHDDRQCAYYQPGFGTYVSATWLAQKTNASKAKSWYLKAKDAAVGSSYGEHVMAGYQYLMRHYSSGDSIYIFGFSRGAFVACVFAEMLDHMGMLETGNDELIRFVWRAFANWKNACTKRDKTGGREDKEFNYMRAFRETFCRPLPQISFLGLFDVVDSIPEIETRHSNLQFPFKARTSAKVIRHAVGIDERRTRFRNELISDVRPRERSQNDRWYQRRRRQHENTGDGQNHTSLQSRGDDGGQRPCWPDEFYWEDPGRQRGRRTGDEQHPDSPAADSGFHSNREMTAADIAEVWFPGAHGDIGGGLSLGPNEDWLLSHVPLVWMLQEAQQRAGLQFDPDKLRQLNCIEDLTVQAQDGLEQSPGGQCPNRTTEDSGEGAGRESQFEYALRSASTNGLLHDSLRYGSGFPWPVVALWRLLEYLPFRRTNLHHHGASWKSVRWPPPRGQARDIPRDADIHTSAVRRMEADSTYRPPNLIHGAQGRSKRGPAAHGIGKWKVSSNEGSPVKKIYRRDDTGNRQ